MQHIVILLQKQIVQKLSLVQIVVIMLPVPGLEENAHISQDAQPLQKQQILNVKQLVIDVLQMELIVLNLMLVVHT